MPNIGLHNDRQGARGLTLVELMIAMGITVMLFSAILTAYFGIKAINNIARSHIQAMQVVRGEMERLKVMGFASIVNAASTAAYDSGKDGVFGNGDDLQGTLTVTVQDFLDMDQDGDSAETAINVDNSGGNDVNAAKPVRVTFSWTQRVLGQNRTLTVRADTLVAS